MIRIVAGKLPCGYRSELNEKLGQLSRARAAELTAKKNEREYALSVYAYAEVFSWAEEKLGRDRNSIVMAREADGKPYIEGAEALCFSISHSFPYYAVAFSDTPVGIDIERVREFSSRVPYRVFTEDERRYSGNDPHRFFEIWTKKEAYAKFTGKGIFSDPGSFDVLMPPLSGNFISRTEDDFVMSVYTEDDRDDTEYIFRGSDHKGEKDMYSTKIDISHIPFSRYGAYAAISATPANEDRTLFRELTFLYAKLRGDKSPIFNLRVGTDPYEDFECSADPTHVTIRTEKGSAVLYIKDDDSIVVESSGLDLKLDSYFRWSYGCDFSDTEFRLIVHHANLFATVYTLEGERTIFTEPESKQIMKRDLAFRCSGGRVKLCVTMALKEPRDIPSGICTEKDLEEIGSEWESFAAQMEDLKNTDRKTEQFTLLTWFNLWSSFVRAEDVYVKDTMLMSKKQMSAVWSWDHCFNALAMARCRDRDLAKAKAMDQFSAPFWLQTDKGMLPDMWNPDNVTKWGTTKPPVHGWCFSKLMDMFEFTEDELTTVYGWLKAWTEWWTVCSDADQDGIPDFPMGCDSGWDNATLFDTGYFVETPDLPAFLIIQMRTLARIAVKLGKDAEAAEWDGKAKQMLARFLEHSWNGERFVAKVSHSHEHQERPTCLLSLMPIVLGDMLPRDILDKLAAVLEKDFLTDNGLATEMPSSSRYEPDGYWRGPIWAPSTYLIVDGLHRSGYDRLAHTVAERYCRMSSEKAHGNYENFDALTGKGLRAPGYTWSASVYMLLRGEYGV